MAVDKTLMQARSLLILARKTAAAFRTSTPTERYKLCCQLIAPASHIKELSELSARLAPLDINERHYWIGTFYTLLLTSAQRRSQAAYFTPPHLSGGIMRLIASEGFDFRTHSAIDPAAGGAAFLSTLSGEMRESGATAADILRRLRGFEIDPGLARLSETLISERVGRDIDAGSLVQVRDSLADEVAESYDLVIANPPYGRVFPADLPDEKWKHVCHPGHINKYALFTELCFRLAKKHGLVVLVLPSSFMAGPLYGRLRSFIRQQGELLFLGAVANRDDVFVDVAQDISILIARTGVAHRPSKMVTFGEFKDYRPFKSTAAARLPLEPEKLWVMPASTSELAVGGANLATYGAILRSGYFVWNREQHRMRPRRYSSSDFPLIWAKNISAGEPCVPLGKSGNGLDFVHFDFESTAIVRTNAVVLQRTTNSSQPRRLVAACVSPSVIRQWGGFVTENHTIVLTGPSARQLKLLSFLLNSAAVDRRYRQLSGTASVSVTLLRELDLPSPAALAEAVGRYGLTEAAIDAAYAFSAAHAERARA